MRGGNIRPPFCTHSHTSTKTHSGLFAKNRTCLPSPVPVWFAIKATFNGIQVTVVKMNSCRLSSLSMTNSKCRSHPDCDQNKNNWEGRGKSWHQLWSILYILPTKKIFQNTTSKCTEGWCWLSNSVCYTCQCGLLPEPVGTKQENAPHSRSLASRSVPGPTGSPWSSGPCPSRTPYTWRCCPWRQARRVYPIQDANECARVHLITLIIQPLVLASPNPPPKKPTNDHPQRRRGGWRGGGGVSSPQFSQPYFPLAAELLSCATWHGHLPCDRCQSSASSSSALIPTPDRWPTPPPLLCQTGYFYTHQHSYARWEGDQGEGWSTSGGRP